MSGKPAPRLATQPRYKQIADWIREAIRSGRLRAGDVLPSQRELAERANVEVGTAARAVSLLMREGLVTKRVRGIRAQVAAGQRETDSQPPQSIDVANLADPVLLPARVLSVQADGAQADIRLELVPGQRFALTLPVTTLIALGLEPGRSLTIELLTQAIDIISGMG